jgi:hypothetical protein
VYISTLWRGFKSGERDDQETSATNPLSSIIFGQPLQHFTTVYSTAPTRGKHMRRAHLIHHLPTVPSSAGPPTHAYEAVD